MPSRILSGGAKSYGPAVGGVCPPGYVRGVGAHKYSCRKRTTTEYEGRTRHYRKKIRGKCPSGYRKSQAKGKKSMCVKQSKTKKSRHAYGERRPFGTTYTPYKGPVYNADYEEMPRSLYTAEERREMREAKGITKGASPYKPFKGYTAY